VQDADSPGPEGLSVLREVEGEVGVVLWKSLRSVLLWAEASNQDRWNLFDEEATRRRESEILQHLPGASPDLVAAVRDLLPLLARPERADAEFVGRACQRITSWAEGKNAPRTRLEFLQAAALACPSEASYALAVGRAARDLTHYSRAEAWYQRALGLSRQVGEWEVYVRAYLSHGNMMLRRGAVPAARRSFLKGLRRSRRQGITGVEGEALHDLCVLEWRAGNRSLALAYGEQAVRVQGPRHTGLPRLAHDIAYLWLEEGQYSHALPVFMATLAKVKEVERPVVLGSIGRAAAGAGDVSGYEWARRRLLDAPPGPGVAESWVDMALAAARLARTDEVEEAARLAESIARARKEGQMRLMAESILADVHRQAASQPKGVVVEDELSNRLARDLLRTLQLVPVSSQSPADV
jgi:tetratricopeptide (TPR) repeat protein